MSNYNYILDMKTWLEGNVPQFVIEQNQYRVNAEKRKKGDSFTIKDWVEGMIKAMLTSMVDWSRIKPHIDNSDIPSIFYNYDHQALKSANPLDLKNKIKLIKCGNLSIGKQMKALKGNIEILEKIEEKYGSVDQYFIEQCGKDYPIVSYSVLNIFINDYKMEQMGLALTCEFLKNMGFDLPKPDTHLKIFFSVDRIGYSNKTSADGGADDKEVFDVVDIISKELCLTRQEIDFIIWAYCAKGYGNICGANPKCHKCVCSDYCRKSVILV